MEHNEALRLQAAEKYLLGELNRAQREEYEEHYFDCPACAEELKVTVAFMESAKQVAGERVPEPVDNKRLAPAPSGWFAWLRPAFAVPAFAAALLLAVVAYQNSVTIPNLRQSSPQAASARVVKSFSFMEVGARGQGALTIPVRPNESYDLEVDFPPAVPGASYVAQIQDDAGRAIYVLPISGEQAKDTVHVSITGGSLQPGKFNFVIFAAPNAGSRSAGPQEIKRLPFTVEFLP
jgi:anti-sigma factor RsiW